MKTTKTILGQPILSMLFAAAVSFYCSHSTADEWPYSTLDRQHCDEGWIALFDGESLFGWHATSNANWHVEDGAIQVDTGDDGFLQTKTRFANFELQLEFSCPATTNSGVFLRSADEPTDPLTDCYEVNIAPRDNPFPTGSVVGRIKSEPTDTTPTASQWRTMRVTANSEEVVVWVDERKTIEYTDSQPLSRGRIGLQFRNQPISFRNIRLRPLGMKPMFNGTDLNGWSDAAADKSRFYVEEGVLRVRNGRGQLESKQAYADFVLQFECRTHAQGLNSGIFFRCIPGDQMMGYESQIQNAFLKGDRTKPTDCGTGGIFRRQDARLVAADDLVWFHKTIIADGAHIATWVNGHQVVDWTDERAADENPRKGLRLEPGTIMIQGHDPTTDLSFRNLRISELPK